MELPEYRVAVIALARRKYKRKLCLDTLTDSFEDQKTVEEAAQTLIDDSELWNN